MICRVGVPIADVLFVGGRVLGDVQRGQHRVAQPAAGFGDFWIGCAGQSDAEHQRALALMVEPHRVMSDIAGRRVMLALGLNFAHDCGKGVLPQPGVDVLRRSEFVGRVFGFGRASAEEAWRLPGDVNRAGRGEGEYDYAAAPPSEGFSSAIFAIPEMAGAGAGCRA